MRLAQVLISLGAREWLWLVLHLSLLVTSLLCLSALYHRQGTSWMTRLAYAVMPIGAGLSVSGFINGDATAVDIGQVITTVGMILWSLRIYSFLKPNGETKERKRRAYMSKGKPA